MEKYHLKASFNAGLLGGFMLLVIQMVILPLFITMDAWEFPSVMATLLVNSTAPDVAVLLVGMVIPVLISILLALLLGWIPATWHGWSMIPVGLMFGTVACILFFLYFVSFDPVMSAKFNLMHYYAFLAYGLIVVYAYRAQIKLKASPENNLHTGYLK